MGGRDSRDERGCLGGSRFVSRETSLSRDDTSHVSCVMCHVSCVMCHVSCVMSLVSRLSRHCER